MLLLLKFIPHMLNKSIKHNQLNYTLISALERCIKRTWWMDYVRHIINTCSVLDQTKYADYGSDVWIWAIICILGFQGSPVTEVPRAFVDRLTTGSQNRVKQWINNWSAHWSDAKDCVALNTASAFLLWRLFEDLFASCFLLLKLHRC